MSSMGIHSGSCTGGLRGGATYSRACPLVSRDAKAIERPSGEPRAVETPFRMRVGDVTALSDLNCCFAAVSRERSRQLKETAQLDRWLWDGSAAYMESLCDWG